MKLGIHLSAWTTEWAESVVPYIEQAAQLGYDGVELPLLDPGDFPVKQVQDILASQGLEVTCGTGLNADLDITSPEPEIRRQGIEHLKKCIEVSSQVGSRVLGGVIYSPWGLTHVDDKSKRYNRFKASFQEVIDYAEQKQVKLALEVINRYETYFLNTVEQGVKIIDDLGSDQVGLHLDSYHANLEEASIPAAIRQAGDKLIHFHAASNHRSVPGWGHLPWLKVKQALAEINYQSWITVETFVEPESQIGRDTFIWRKIAANPEELARESINYLAELFREGRS